MDKNKNTKEKNTKSKNFEQINNPFEKKLKRIKDEMDVLNPDTLLLKINPAVDSTKTVEQIQSYYYLINNEISKYYNYQTIKKELNEKNKELNKEIAEKIHPKKENLPNQEEEEKKRLEYLNYDERINKPIIDYRVKIRSLENNIVYTYQYYNKSKSKNLQLMVELDELRKTVYTKNKKLEELKKELEEEEKKYNKEKKEIEDNLEKKDDIKIYGKIKKNQKLLESANKEMIEKIKETDKFMIERQAKKKYLDYETKQLEKKAKKIEKKNKKDFEDFNNLHKEEMEKVRKFDQTSRIIDSLDQKKMKSLENMLNEMFNETKTENIQQFIDYFIKSCEEYKTFQDTIKTLTTQVNKLEKEVDELEYILNFCEENLYVYNQNNLDEEEMKEIKDLKLCSEQFINVQYQAINEAYKEFQTNLSESMLKNEPELENNETFKNDFLTFYVQYLNEMQEKLKTISQSFRKKREKGDYFDFNQWDNKWEKAEKIKENVQNEYERTGSLSKFDLKSINNMVNEVLLRDKIKKKKKKIFFFFFYKNTSFFS